MKPWMWYVYGILPMQGLPMNALRYMTTGHVPTSPQLAGGVAGSTATTYALGYLVHPKIPEVMMYHKLRMMGFQIGSKSSYWSGGPLWRVPIWARAGGYAYGVYSIHQLYNSPSSNATAALPGNRFDIVRDRLFG